MESADALDQPLSQDSLSSLLPASNISEPATPEPAHASISQGTTETLSRLHAERVDNATIRMTPPPSTQVPSSQRTKTRTPTPTTSHISTPPPTVDATGQVHGARSGSAFFGALSGDQIADASAEELMTTVTELHADLQEAKMAAAHYKLQYQMLSQESAAAIERMAVEVRMAECEGDMLDRVKKDKASSPPPAQPTPMQPGDIPVHKDEYQRMCRELKRLTADREHSEMEHAQNEKTIAEQECQIERLTEKVSLLQQRILETSRQRRSLGVEGTPRSAYSTPLRHGVGRYEQPQSFAALLQASEMASQEARHPSGARKGHSRNTHSLSSLPITPSKSRDQTLYQTPPSRHAPIKVPSTAPAPRTSTVRRTPLNVYSQPQLPVYGRNPHSQQQQQQQQQGPQSEDTVSASEHSGDDHEDNYSEAETDIIEPDEDVGVESQASRTASAMLRTSQEDQRAKRESFKGNGMLSASAAGSSAEKYRQTKLFGAVTKANLVRAGEDDDQRPPAKRARTAAPPPPQLQAVGLGIAGVKN